MNDEKSKGKLKELYGRLINYHPHDLLALESRLPSSLRCNQRDKYRTVITMILSQGTNDRKLSQSLGCFFGKYPNLNDLQNITRQELETVLAACGFTTKGYAGQYNVDRMWHLIETLGNQLNTSNLTAFVKKLPLQGYGHGYGEKMVRVLKAYVLGQQNLLPLDTPGFEVLKNEGLCSSVNQCREQIERVLSTESDITLIDFHEMLRFKGQTELKGIKRGSRRYDDIIKGWNAWRMICAKDDSKFNEDWIRKNLVKNKRLAKELWSLYSYLKDTYKR